MRRLQSPHFERHRRELQQNRRRFSVAVLALCVVISVALGVQFRGGQAATMATVSGRVYNSSTGAGLSGVTLKLCSGNPNVVTNSSGNWSYTMTQWHWFCVEYSSGAPSTVTFRDAPNRTAEAKAAGVTYYESQVAGVDCYHSSSCSNDAPKYDRSVDTGYDLRFLTKATPTPTPTPTPTRTPTPVPTPVPTPKTPTPTPRTPTPVPRTPTPVPQSTPTSGGGGGGSTSRPSTGSKTPTPTPAVAEPDTTPPSAPGGFEASVTGSNAVIDMQWQAADDAGGVRSYRLERSVDAVSWTPLADSLTGLDYHDKAVAFDLRYYYRVAAVDKAGNMSAYSYADATTPKFASNVSVDTATTYTSDDQVVSLLLPSGAVEANAECSITKDESRRVDPKDLKLAAGVYDLVCKTEDGSLITDFSKPLTWNFNLKDQMKGLEQPTAYMLDESGTAVQIKGAKYDADSKILSFDSSSSQAVYVLAAKASGLPISLIALVVTVMLAAGGVVAVVLRRRQKLNYDEYLRQKYYNL